MLIILLMILRVSFMPESHFLTVGMSFKHKIFIIVSCFSQYFIHLFEQNVHIHILNNHHNVQFVKKLLQKMTSLNWSLRMQLHILQLILPKHHSRLYSPNNLNRHQETSKDYLILTCVLVSFDKLML